MPKNQKIDVPDVRAALDLVVAEQPDRKDRRAANRLEPRYVEDGAPACLVAAVLHRLNFTLGLLKSLDHEAGRHGGGVVLSDSKSPIRRRFTPEAWALLAFLQKENDRRGTWEQARREAFSVDSYWMNRNPRFAYPGPWCTADNAIGEK